MIGIVDKKVLFLAEAVIAVAIVLLLVRGLAEYDLKLAKDRALIEEQQNSASSPLSSSEPNAGFLISQGTEDWEIYRNEDYGYELKYPPEFTYIDKNDRDVSFRKNKLGSDTSTSIDFSNREKYEGGLDVYLGRDQYGKNTAEEWVDTENRVAVGAPEYSPYAKIRYVDVDGAKGLIVRDARARGSWDPDGRWNFVAIFRRDNYLFKVGYMNTAEELEQVLSTFKFIPKKGIRLDINKLKKGDVSGDFIVQSVDIFARVVKFSGKTTVRGSIGLASGRYGAIIYFTVSEKDGDKIPRLMDNDGLPHLLLEYEDKDYKALQELWGKQKADLPVEIEVSGFTTFSDPWDTWGSTTFAKVITPNAAD